MCEVHAGHCDDSASAAPHDGDASKGQDVRTNIDIDDQLLADAQSLSGSSTKKQTVERALKLMVELGRQSKVRRLRGRFNWDGDLEEMRRDER